MATQASTIKVVVLGAGCQGKSALILRFVSGIFVTDYDPTIEDDYRKLHVVDDSEPVLLEILDTAGQEEYASMMDQWMEEGQIFILVYSVNCEKECDSLDILTPYQHCSYLKEKIIRVKGEENIPMILVATKCDLSDDQRNYTKEDGEDLAKELKCPYIEISAKTNYNMDILWNMVVLEYNKYIKSQGTNYKFSLQSNHRGSIGGTTGNNNCCCSCNWMRNHQRTASSPKIHQIISSNDAINIDTETEENKCNDNKIKINTNKSKHIRVNTESEMMPIDVEEKDIINPLNGINENEDEEELEAYIAEIVINDNKANDDDDFDDDDDDGDNKQNVYIPKLSMSSDIGNKDQIKLFPVIKLPKDEIFEPILTSRDWRIHRRFYYKRFIISILCGISLPLILVFQTFAFLLYIESNSGGFYYPKQYKYNDIHHGILFDFLGIVIGRKPDQDPEIEKDRKWFLRQTCLQKIQRVLLTLWICVLYNICIYNVYQGITDKTLRVSIMETIGPFLLLSVIWILLSLWIAYESNLNPKVPPLTRLRSINLYFGERFDQTTSAYKFLRGYLSSTEKHWKLGYFNIFIIIILSLFYASIPGITRVSVGDPQDGLEKKKFITYREWRVEVGALIINAFLMTAVMYTVEVIYSKHMEKYREWMHELTMFLMCKENKPDNQLDDDFDDDLNDEFQEPSYSHDQENEAKYLPKNLYLSLGRSSNALGWLEIRCFLASQGLLFFGEQELPILWMLIITCSLTIFILYRVFFISGNPVQSILFNGVSILTIICLSSLIRIMITAQKFEALQERQESLIEIQKFVMRCDKKYAINDDDDIDEEKEEEKEEEEIDDMNNDEIEPLIPATKTNEMLWYSRNVGFIEDMLTLIKRKDIYPKLYKIKLNSVLIPTITIIIISAIVILLKLFVQILLTGPLHI